MGRQFSEGNYECKHIFHNEGGRSYVPALQNIPETKGRKEIGLYDKINPFSSNSEEANHYKKAFIGRIKHPGIDVDLKKIFMEEEIFSTRVTNLGPNLCLLEDLIESEVENFINEKKSWREQWFDCIKMWESLDIDRERFAWIRIYGVPFHVWGEQFFRMLAESWGLFVKSDEGTSLKSRMDVARVCIKTKRMDRVDDTIKVQIESFVFPMRIMKEISFFNVKKSFATFREESESQFTQTEEDETDEEEGEAKIEGNEVDDVDDGKDGESQKVEGVEIAFKRKLSPNNANNQPIAKKVDFDFIEKGTWENTEAEKDQSLNGDRDSSERSRVGDSFSYNPDLIISAERACGKKVGCGVDTNLGHTDLGQ